MPGRIGALLAGVWAGLMAGVGAIAASVLFASLPRADAGRIAGRLFAIEATVGLAAGAVLAIIALQVGRQRGESGAGRRFGSELMLALAALLCLVLGYYALQPMMEASRQGQGSVSFGVIHAASTGFFAVRLALVAALAWRFGAPSQESMVPAATRAAR